MRTPFKIFREDKERIELPVYAYEGDSGMDVRAYFERDDDKLHMKPGQRITVPTGIHVGLKQGEEIQVRPRSGLAHKQGLTVVNAPGTIDSNYTGAIGVILLNTGDYPIEIAHGDRIAQLVMCPVLVGEAEEVNSLKDLEETNRSDGAYGSTGHK